MGIQDYIEKINYEKAVTYPCAFLLNNSDKYQEMLIYCQIRLFIK